MGRFHRHRCHILDLVSPTPGRVLFGPAVTISCFPSCSVGLDPDEYNFGNLCFEAVGDDPEGKVVVLASNGYVDSSVGRWDRPKTLYQAAASRAGTGRPVREDGRRPGGSSRADCKAKQLLDSGCDRAGRVRPDEAIGAGRQQLTGRPIHRWPAPAASKEPSLGCRFGPMRPCSE